MKTSAVLPWAHRAPHRVTDSVKLASMITVLSSGGDLPPVLWDGNQAYEGSHRLAAWEALGMYPTYILVGNADLADAAKILGGEAENIDWMDEHNLSVLWDVICGDSEK